MMIIKNISPNIHYLYIYFLIFYPFKVGIIKVGTIYLDLIISLNDYSIFLHYLYIYFSSQILLMMQNNYHFDNGFGFIHL